VAQERDWWRTVLETLVMFWFAQKAVIFYLSEGKSASEVGKCCMELAAHQLVKSVREMTNGI